MVKKNYLLTPGPSQVPPETLAKLAQPVWHHRTPQFIAAWKEATERLARLLETKNEVYLLTGSGSIAMEAAVTNLVSREGKALVLNGGKFGERFVELCQAYRLNHVDEKVPWGQPADPAVVEKYLAQDQSIQAVFCQLTETSTGTLNDVQALGAVVKKTGACLVVDAISGAAGDRCPVDEWGVDVLIAGSQKALMMPPGLAVIAVSEKAWKLIGKNGQIPAYYADLRKYRQGKDDTPFTPANTLVEALCVSLRQIEKEGLENVYARHELLARAVRAAAGALGLALFSARPSNVITAIKVPPGVEGDKIPSLMRDKWGVVVTGGQSQLKGKIVRIAHMGYAEPMDVIVGVAALELALRELGAAVALGRGVAAAQEVLAAGWQG